MTLVNSLADRHTHMHTNVRGQSNSKKPGVRSLEPHANMQSRQNNGSGDEPLWKCKPNSKDFLTDVNTSEVSES